MQHSTAGTGLGRGKTVDGLPKRRKKILRDNIEGISKGTVRRLARRGGVKRISANVYSEVRVAAKAYLTERIRDIIAIVEGRPQNKTVCVNDVVYALRRVGRTIYGFGEPKR